MNGDPRIEALVVGRIYLWHSSFVNDLVLNTIVLKHGRETSITPNKPDSFGVSKNRATGQWSRFTYTRLFSKTSQIVHSRGLKTLNNDLENIYGIEELELGSPFKKNDELVTLLSVTSM